MTIAVVMGVSGCGKTTIAAGLAKRFGWTLLEGDSFHSPENVAKMASGTPLTDEDRWPWLRAIAARADELAAQRTSVVIACSALKRAYRDILIGGRKQAVLIYLRGSKDVIGARMAARKGHFMPPGLLDSQFATLEEPGADEHPIIADVRETPDKIILDIAAQLGKRST